MCIIFNLFVIFYGLVNALVKQWSPLVWLAPNEKYLPGNVRTFLQNVHAEREKPHNKKIKDISENPSFYYDYAAYKDLIYYEGINPVNGSNRNKRNFDKDTSLEFIFELPIDEASENWFLVTNEDLDSLIKNKSSFIYGESPSTENVPIYSVVSMCSSPTKPEPDTHFNEIEQSRHQYPYKKNPYIPLTKYPEIYDYERIPLKPFNTKIQIEPSNPIKKTLLVPINPISPIKPLAPKDFPEPPTVKFVQKRSLEVEKLILEPENITNPVVVNDTADWQAIPPFAVFKDPPSIPEATLPVKIPFKINLKREKINFKIHKNRDSLKDLKIPHFHVTYWMFYPYSEGKSLCTLNLGPLGPLPIPLLPIFNICLGTRKEFGSHVGDWEHVSLFFRGKLEPDEMYISTHDAGAFYSYDRITSTFAFKSQETRKGILQQPNFPKTVITSDHHPVLFAAEGSHGLWSAPGKHKFVRVPRLYDTNGFGQPWYTWKNMEIIYDDARGKRSLNPNWMKYRGRWGNQKSRCHPLRKIGLHFCEKSDGPTGIPRKTEHFTCSIQDIVDRPLT